jgi:DNA-binding response OmpR family regulator
MTPSNSPAKAPLKIFLLSDEKHEGHFRTLTADESTLFWRPTDPKDDLDATLGEERFDILIANYRDSTTDVLGAVEELRKLQPKAQIILVCRKLELEEIMRAIRLGVRDVFTPPLDFRKVASRIETLALSGGKPHGKPDETALGRWEELIVRLSDEPVPKLVPLPSPQLVDRKPERSALGKLMSSVFRRP